MSGEHDHCPLCGDDICRCRPDLPERLRELADTLEGGEWEHPITSQADCLAAAERIAELERTLRTVIAQWDGVNQQTGEDQRVHAHAMLVLDAGETPSDAICADCGKPCCPTCSYHPARHVHVCQFCGGDWAEEIAALETLAAMQQCVDRGWYVMVFEYDERIACDVRTFSGETLGVALEPTLAEAIKDAAEEAIEAEQRKDGES